MNETEVDRHVEFLRKVLAPRCNPAKVDIRRNEGRIEITITGRDDRHLATAVGEQDARLIDVRRLIEEMEHAMVTDWCNLE